MRALILGAGGMLGRDLVGLAPPGIAVLPFTHADLDITSAPALAAVVARERPDLIVNGAAYTAVDRAESERDACYRVNAEAVSELGALGARARIKIVHLSTDYVFDGSASEPYAEDSPTDPVNTYGAAKLAGERALLRSGADALIIRTQWLFGLHGKCFPRTMWDRAIAKSNTKVVDDQFGRPTFTPDLARGLWDLVTAATTGIVHMANDGQATWFDVAAQVFERAGRRELLTRCSSSEFPTPAKRPRYSVLRTTRCESILGRRLPHWPDAVDRFLDAQAALGTANT